MKMDFKFMHEYVQLGKKLYWYDVTLVHASYEYDRCYGKHVEHKVRFALLGLWFCFTFYKCTKR